jgi:zinc protease
MQKYMPLVLVLFLVAAAAFLSLNKPADKPETPPETIGNFIRELDAEAAAAADLPPVDPRPWAHEASDIAPDPDAVWGHLPNGFRYVILPNPEPPTRLSIRLHVAAGSLMEEDDQRGLAHFLEHMVFNGTRNHTAKELIPRMQRLGIAFGAHANAYTSFDETVYMLDLPDLNPDTLQLAFTVMRDFGDGALLEAEEIDSERGIILSEKMSRDSVSMRIMEQQFDALLPGSRLTARFPIGTPEVIQNAPRERFVDFYTRYYTPQRMTLVVAGDIEVEEMRKTITRYFSGLKNPENPGTDPDLGPIRMAEGIEASVFSDPELATTDVSLTILRPWEKRADTTADRASRLPLALAHAMLSRRFERLSQEENSPIASGSASNSNIVRHIDYGSIDITAADDRWAEVVPVIEQEFRRVMQHGFTSGELEEAKANLLNAYQRAVRQKPTRRSEGVASMLAGTINNHSVFSSPETNLAIIEPALQTVDIEACANAFRQFWDAPGHHLVLTAKSAPDDAKTTLAKLFEDSRGVEVEPPAARVIPIFAYDEFGAPGTVVSRKDIEDLGITQLVLSNNIRINLKTTDFEKDRIRLLARIGSGKLTQPDGTPMLDLFASSVFNGGGLGLHSTDDLRVMLAGRTVGTTLDIGDDAFSLGGVTTPDDLKLQLQLMTAALIDPGWRNEGLWDFQRAIPSIFQTLKHTTAGPAQEMSAWLHSGDFRHTVASREALSAYTIEDARKWIDPQLAKAYLELSIIGDFEVEAIIPELLATFGAIPARASEPEEIAARRKIAMPAAPAAVEFNYESKVPQGVAITIWSAPGPREGIPAFRRLNILGSIFGDRLRNEIRENLGASYSPNAGADGNEAYDGFGFIMGQSEAQPKDLDALLETMLSLADDLATKGATQDELDRALNPILGQLEETLRDNGYWLGTVMSRSQQDPARLDLARNRDADYRAITLAEVNALAAAHLGKKQALQVRIRPVEETAE